MRIVVSGRGARSALVAAACGLVALGGTHDARAEQCSGDNQPELFAPAPGSVDRPTDVHLWMLFSRVNRVWLSTVPMATNLAIETQLVQHVHGGELFTEVIPPASLRPNTKYYVQIERPSSETILYDFTTGDRATDPAPNAPMKPLHIFTWRYDRTPLRCIPGKYIFRVVMPGGRMTGSLYALEKQTDLGFVRVAFSDVPDFITFGDELPSPFFRIRPMSVSGTADDPSALPLVRSERVDKVEGGQQMVSDPSPLPDDGAWDDEENWAGCAAGGGVAGAAWAVILAAGWAASGRGRRRRP